MVEIFEPDADPEALDELTRSLRQELLELDVDSVSPVRTEPAPAGSKGLDVAAIGALLVQVAGSVDAVTTIIGAVRSWLHRGSPTGRSLKISIDGHTLELTSATEDQQQQLIDEFVRALPTSS
jgi:Effector Associated Constant Component 1